MNEKELYEQVLGLHGPWRVDSVEPRLAEGEILIHVSHGRGRLPCPECGAPCPVHDHAEERRWRHLDTCEYRTIVCARPPRVRCKEHGTLRVSLPWAVPLSRFTLKFEAFAVEVLKRSTISGAAEILGLSWDEAFNIMNRTVDRGRAAKAEKPLPRIGVDEKAIAKGHKYMTLVYDITNRTVEYIGDGRGQESLVGFYETLSPVQLAGIQAVAMDMWSPYVNATLECVPNAETKIVFDRFHVMQHMNKAVDKVRRDEHREMLSARDQTLTGSRFLWLYGVENVPQHRWRDFEVIRARAKKTARAWSLKETLRELWRQPTIDVAVTLWRRWYAWARRSRLHAVKKVALTVKTHIANILTYYRHKVTNSTAEGVNSLIDAIQRLSRGFRNREHFRTAVYFHCGGLQLTHELSASH